MRISVCPSGPSPPARSPAPTRVSHSPARTAPAARHAALFAQGWLHTDCEQRAEGVEPPFEAKRSAQADPSARRACGFWGDYTAQDLVPGARGRAQELGACPGLGQWVSRALPEASVSSRPVESLGSKQTELRGAPSPAPSPPLLEASGASLPARLPKGRGGGRGGRGRKGRGGAGGANGELWWRRLLEPAGSNKSVLRRQGVINNQLGGSLGIL